MARATNESIWKQQKCAVPRNKEIMRIFKDLELVESLGTGIPRIVKAYGKECFKFSHNFMKMVFPVTTYDNDQDTIEVPRKYPASAEINRSI